MLRTNLGVGGALGLSLLGFFMSRKENSLLNLPFFILSLLGEQIVVLTLLLLLIALMLQVLYFLLNFFFITPFKVKDVGSTLLGLLDLFPGLHFFLLEQGDSIGKQLRVPVNVLSAFLGLSKALLFALNILLLLTEFSLNLCLSHGNLLLHHLLLLIVGINGLLILLLLLLGRVHFEYNITIDLT